MQSADSGTAVYSTLIVAGKSVPSALRLRETLGYPPRPDDDQWGQLIVQSYKRTQQFFLNEFYRESLRTNYLGGGWETLSTSPGKVWVDWVHLRHDELDINLVHLHFRFPDLTINHENRCDPGIRAIVDFLGSAYQFIESSDHAFPRLGLLKKACSPRGSSRRTALPLSRYTYASLVGVNIENVSGPGIDLTTNLYRLLYLHADGVSPTVAQGSLADNYWQTTEFCRSYYQPGGMVSISSAYPEPDYTNHPKWFRPDPEDPPTAPWPKPDYDRLPEYPPLRYLASPALDFLALYEESVRDTFELVLAPGRDLDFEQVSSAKLRLSVHRTHLAQNLEAIRLPITRPIISGMIDARHQDRANTAIEKMILNRRSDLTMWFALAAATIGLVALIIAVVRLANGS